jgi:hypothetical protein
METLKFTGMIIFLVGVYALMNDDDYHKEFDKPHIVRYNCDKLIAGWHPDVPPEVIKKCRDPNERTVRVTTYKD